ncbi:hypothetical protein EDB86DRAFT_2830927 [Lactarius hatsudake]|nr:hypothetical protein EDB86DRAFT_2830927 [Lactarius hatsudake]
MRLYSSSSPSASTPCSTPRDWVGAMTLMPLLGETVSSQEYVRWDPQFDRKTTAFVVQVRGVSGSRWVHVAVAREEYGGYGWGDLLVEDLLRLWGVEILGKWWWQVPYQKYRMCSVGVTERRKLLMWGPESSKCPVCWNVPMMETTSGV